MFFVLGYLFWTVAFDCAQITKTVEMHMNNKPIEIIGPTRKTKQCVVYVSFFLKKKQNKTASYTSEPAGSINCGSHNSCVFLHGININYRMISSEIP